MAVSPHACPHCGRPEIVRLDYSSTHAWVDYYRCASCGHVWTTSRDGVMSRDVTRYADEMSGDRVDIRCTHCHAHVALQVTPVEGNAEPYGLRHEPWSCPVCHRANAVYVAGRIAGVDPL